MNNDDHPVKNESDALPDSTNSDTHTPIVIGIGASAGGVEAFEAFFNPMPTDSGMAFVVIQHLAPDRDSILAQIIQRYTKMPVQQVENDMVVIANHVYVIPPNNMLGLSNGKLQLLQQSDGTHIRLPLDYFFRSLALEMHERAIGIILSGTASDGTLGLKAIKEEGGLVIAQDPTTAAYDGMPRNAIATGLVDFILAPEAMPDQLASYRRLALDATRSMVTLPQNVVAESLQQILFMIRSQTGQDFFHYKESTIRRRIERMMAVNQIEKIEDYVRFLQNNSIGVETLFRDMLIGVTSFFRDKDVFKSLQETVIPRLFENRRANQTIRIWVPGCSTGEEAYSIAILMRHHMMTLRQEFRVQIFATDIDINAVDRARLGIYASNIALDVPEEYLSQYFLITPDGYQITKTVREMLVFAVHSVTQDPPFSKLDLISCRNLLIYLDTQLQSKVLSYFHFALAPNGFLVLGASESLGKHDREFRIHDLQHKIFERSQSIIPLRLNTDIPSLSAYTPEKDTQTTIRTPVMPTLREITETMLLKDWTPTCVIINHEGNIRYVNGRTGKYLEISTGDTHKLDIIRSAREALKTPLTTAIYRAITQQREIYEPGLRVETNGGETFFNLIVKPLTTMPNENLLAVFFDEIEFMSRDNTADPEKVINPSDEREQKSRLLQQELTDTREYLQAIIEELKSSNEEMQSMNEELQSVNEELETSQEELQAVNEELLTTNSELERKVEEATWANNDLENTLNSIQTGIILLDAENHVRRFNPAAAQVFRLDTGDLGRSINHIVSDLNYPTLIEDIEKVFNSLVSYGLDIQTRDGRWYAFHMKPYRTSQNAIKGVVISFNDVTTQRRTEAIEAARLLGDNVFNTVREPLVLIDANLQVINANQAFFRVMQVTPEETVGLPLSELGDGDWNIPELVSLIKAVFENGVPLEDYEVTLKLPTLGIRKILVNARQIQAGNKQPMLVLLALEGGLK